MSNKDLIPELNEEQLDKLLTYTPAFFEQNLANIKARSFEKTNHMEKPVMKKSIFRRFGTVAAAALAIMAVTTTVFAAWHFLRPSEVAGRAGDVTLSAAFESESAININQSITSGNHIFTLLAVVSGEDITDHPIYNSTGEILRDRTYAVLAIQAADSSPMPLPMDAEYQPFTVSPFIRGESPQHINAFTMDAGSISMVVDRVMYMIVDFTNVTMFADRGVYLGVNSGMTMSHIQSAFDFNDQTSEITANPNFAGSNAVFRLPFDSSIADPVRAAEILKANPTLQAAIKAENDYDNDLTELDELDPPFFYEAFPTTVALDTLQRMDYERLRAWIQKEMTRLRASGDYSNSVLTLFEQDHTRMLDAVRDGFYFYMNEDGWFWQAINPAYADLDTGFELAP